MAAGWMQTSWEKFVKWCLFLMCLCHSAGRTAGIFLNMAVYYFLFFKNPCVLCSCSLKARWGTFICQGPFVCLYQSQAIQTYQLKNKPFKFGPTLDLINFEFRCGWLGSPIQMISWALFCMQTFPTHALKNSNAYQFYKSIFSYDVFSFKWELR